MADGGDGLSFLKEVLRDLHRIPVLSHCFGRLASGKHQNVIVLRFDLSQGFRHLNFVAVFAFYRLFLQRSDVHLQPFFQQPVVGNKKLRILICVSA